MKLSILLPLLVIAYNSFAQEINIPFPNMTHYYRRVLCSDSSNVTLLSISLVGDRDDSLHVFSIQSGALVQAKLPKVPSFDNCRAVSSLPNVSIGPDYYFNLLFVATRNDSFFLINTFFNPQMDFHKLNDVKLLTTRTLWIESTASVSRPSDGTQYSFLSFFSDGGPNADAHALVRILPDHTLEVQEMDSTESQKIAILHHIKDFAFFDGYYYLTGYNSPLSAIVDSNLNIVDKGNTLYYDPFNSDNDYSLRGYVFRQVTEDRMTVIGEGYYGNYPMLTVRPTIQTVAIENGEIIFGDHTAYAITDRSIEDVLATQISPELPYLYLAGGERESFDNLSPTYIYIKKLVGSDEEFYKRYGNDRFYGVRDISLLANGNPLICGFYSAQNTAFGGFFMLLDKEGNPITGTQQASTPFHALELFPMPASDKIHFKNDLSWDTHIEIFDLLGNSRYSGKNKNINQVDITDLSTGVYILTAQDSSGKYSSKFLKIDR
jgi:Secretion system C-terminal sorting domain